LDSDDNSPIVRKRVSNIPSLIEKRFLPKEELSSVTFHNRAKTTDPRVMKKLAAEAIEG
jgi:hypothetical protein